MKRDQGGGWGWEVDGALQEDYSAFDLATARFGLAGVVAPVGTEARRRVKTRS